ncbi:hypothetical protein NBRC111894_3507 [Sporolactobacillus inulinus]|uniref:Uncharacterized protein n=1 Tax=Sporolactobacillus inulinus TaxID=2078 RepID=A0A4Y1ZG47_9BACL|nr:hypothetical protein NBRC111894_3507 [Sporolactobacillus inulinus]
MIEIVEEGTEWFVDMRDVEAADAGSDVSSRSGRFHFC